MTGEWLRTLQNLIYETGQLNVAESIICIFHLEWLTEYIERMYCI